MAFAGSLAGDTSWGMTPCGVVNVVGTALGLNESFCWIGVVLSVFGRVFDVGGGLRVEGGFPVVDAREGGR